MSLKNESEILTTGVCFSEDRVYGRGPCVVCMHVYRVCSVCVVQN